MEFKKGDKVRINPEGDYPDQGREENGDHIKGKVFEAGKTLVRVKWDNGGAFHYNHSDLLLWDDKSTKTNKENKNMEITKSVLKVYEKSEDAKKVTVNFAEDIMKDCFILELILKNNKDEILKEADRREKEIGKDE